MQIFNTQYKDKKSLKDFISKNNISNYDNLLVQVFSGIIDEKKTTKLSSELKKMLPSANIIGTTTAGEICDGKLFDKTITISFSVFDTTLIRSNFYLLDEHFKLEDIFSDLIVDNTKALIIFSDGLKSNAERLLKSINDLRSDIVIAGGRAGDNFRF